MSRSCGVQRWKRIVMLPEEDGREWDVGIEDASEEEGVSSGIWILSSRASRVSHDRLKTVRHCERHDGNFHFGTWRESID